MKKCDNWNLLKATINEQKEKNWDNRFTTLKISEYDSYKDINYLSLGLIKAKIKYEKNEDRKLKIAYSKKEPYLNNKMHLNNLNKNNDFLNNKYIKNNNLPISKLNIKNYSYNKFYSYTIPNSCRKSKIDKNIDINFFKNEEIKKNEKKSFSPLYKFKKNNNYIINSNFSNFGLNDIKLKIKEDEDLNELYNIVKELWKNYGVTIQYQNNFLLSLNNCFLSTKMIYELLNIERKNMVKFKNEYSSVINRIEQRNNEIENIQKLIKEYPDKNNDIKNKINNSLKLLRLYTINLVSQIKKFYLINSYPNLSGKIDLKKIKLENYSFDLKYLAEIKTDLNFLKYSSIRNLYNFNNIENDPFLLSLSDISKCDNTVQYNNLKYEALPITEDEYNQIIKLLYFMGQIEINEKIKQQNQKIINNKNNLNKNNNYSDNFLSVNNDLNIGNNYKGNINNIINELKNEKHYEDIFLNTVNTFNNKNKRKFNIIKKTNFVLKNDSDKNKIKNINYNEMDIPLTTAGELRNKFIQYDKMKKIIEDESNKK